MGGAGAQYGGEATGGAGERHGGEAPAKSNTERGGSASKNRRKHRVLHVKMQEKKKIIYGSNNLEIDQGPSVKATVSFSFQVQNRWVLVIYVINHRSIKKL
jgi:hypothetical protein